MSQLSPYGLELAQLEALQNGVPLKGKNVADGTDLTGGVSFEIDENGYAVLRTVDAAPFAYDVARALLKVGTAEKLGRYRDLRAGVIAAGASDIIDLFAGAGNIAEITAIGVFAPAIASSTGNHSWNVVIGTDSAYAAERIINVAPAATSPVEAQANSSTIQQAVKGVRFTDTVPLRLIYNNSSNLATTGSRLIVVHYVERPSYM